MQHVPSLIYGDLVTSFSLPNIPVTDPANNDVILELTCTTEAELALAMVSVKQGSKNRKSCLLQQRAWVMIRYEQLLEEHHDEIATILSSETAKTLAYTKGDAWCGINVVEQTMRFYTKTKTMIARWFEENIPCGPNMTISLK